MADLAQGSLRNKRTRLAEALRGHVTEHHRFLLRLHLDQIDALQHAVREVEARLGESLAPFRYAAQLLITMPGVSDTVAHVILAEIGVDMTRFPSAGHLISWAGLCPRMDESAGKRRSMRTRRGAPWLKTRRGAKKAILAVASSMLKASYYMLRDGVEYRDLGADYFDKINKDFLARRLVRCLGNLGFEVQLRVAS